MKVGIGLGSNVGDRLRHLQQAKSYLISLSAGAWHQVSPVYETLPVDCPAGSRAFLNAAVEIEFNGTPHALLKQLQVYEVAHGRHRSQTCNAARTIDLDILYFGDEEVVTNDLVIPHPRLAERRFVLVPLATVCPERTIKGTAQTVRGLLRALPERSGDVRFIQQDW